jgi:hypothetical protein
MSTPAWRRLVDHVMAVPERVYEHWNNRDGWDNHTQWGIEYGEDGVPYCVIGAWDMYHECGLDKAVPKVDNVVVFSDWARTHGEWSEYPSVGAWTNFGNGHCEVVIGFNDTDVVTKGWNSIQAGAADSGQGNGVWEHTNPRRSNRIVGYFAPHFPDGVCPPTADPRDPRGGKAVASWRWSPPAPAVKPSVSLAHVIYAAKHDPAAAQGHTSYKGEALLVERALHAEGLLGSQYVDGSFGTKSVEAYARWQRSPAGGGYTGDAADGIPGKPSLKLLAARHGFTVTD